MHCPSDLNGCAASADPPNFAFGVTQRRGRYPWLNCNIRPWYDASRSRRSRSIRLLAARRHVARAGHPGERPGQDARGATGSGQRRPTTQYSSELPGLARMTARQIGLLPRICSSDRTPRSRQARTAATSSTATSPASNGFFELWFMHDSVRSAGGSARSVPGRRRFNPGGIGGWRVTRVMLDIATLRRAHWLQRFESDCHGRYSAANTLRLGGKPAACEIVVIGRGVRCGLARTRFGFLAPTARR